MADPFALARIGLKLLGYRMGQIEARLPLAIKLELSMHPGFWTSKSGQHPR
jgi:rhamnosyltransferase